ncbi:MAG: lysoplasmalogenase [Gammaproteobacteria bacterium]|jgi:uncharacterized membrane protein YhhN|nr:lysoplasmalogenase [Gammaproteobacteria bacterium]|tara:strand:- start:4 stop:657 length:654 start_codon:yes stop_codon:yes gene_type:complete
MTLTTKFSATYAICCLIYLIVSGYLAPELSGALKILPIILLGLLTLSTTINSVTSHLSLALLFSMGGDILLELGYFVPGLISFLLAQFTYAALFTRYYSPWNKRIVISILIIAFSAVMSVLLWNTAADMRLPVLVYLVVITMMGLSANVSTIQGVLTGAIIFMISDSLIAIYRFVVPIPASGRLIMVSYYLAQYILVTSVLEQIESNSKRLTRSIQN